MAGEKRKESEPSSVNQGTPKRARPSKPLQKPGSKTDANGGGVRNADNDFFDDKETWIRMYYTLLSRKAAQQQTMPIPPTFQILLLFNAYFQGFKEPIGRASQDWDGDWLVECVAAPTRTRRNLIKFETAVQCVCPELKTHINILREQRPHYVNTDNASVGMFVTPEQIARVLQEAGTENADGVALMTALDSLTLPVPAPAQADSWKTKAVAYLDVHETERPDDHPRRLDCKWHH